MTGLSNKQINQNSISYTTIKLLCVQDSLALALFDFATEADAHIPTSRADLPVTLYSIPPHCILSPRTSLMRWAIISY
jgi:hypothetical protein